MESSRPLSQNCSQPEKKNFICGVIEGFYGRPWTTEQRKDLFRKLKKWGMDSYVYAPKDDYKHRAYWRELYTVEEADHLSSLIAAAKEHDIIFYYALSPGLDMTYSTQKEIQTLKRKLEQVSQIGCEAFALLFDDIESELSKTDKEVFQTFGNAQVSVTNEIYTHLNNPKFLFCPTQYCSSRAVPTVHDSEYLNTLGSKLNQDIDIMWTGNKVISKTITVDSIQEITQVLRRPPVIWDNLHANDYDQKRVFLGPYSGRSPELIPHLRGVMTNPNCEFHANTIAIYTLACWSKCSSDAKVNNSLSADIKLETENEDGTCNDDDVPPTSSCLTKRIYHPRMALKTAIAEWLPEFSVEKEAWGPITKPQPQVTMVMPIIPIIPSINTCMSLTTTTSTSTDCKTSVVPEVNTNQLQALADVCSTVNATTVNPIANPVMNSLLSATKVVTNDDLVNPITPIAATNIELPKTIPISSVTVPIMNAKSIETLIEPLSGTIVTGGGGGGGAAVEKEETGTILEENILNHAIAESTMMTSTTTPTTITMLPELNGNSKAETETEIREPSPSPLPPPPPSHLAGNVIDVVTDEKIRNVINNKACNDDDDVPFDEREEGAAASGGGVTAIVPTSATASATATTTATIASASSESCHMLLEDTNPSPLSAGNEPMECSSSLTSQLSPREDGKQPEDVVMAETVSITECNASCSAHSMLVETSPEPSPLSNADEMKEDDDDDGNDGRKATISCNDGDDNSSCIITEDDLYLLCDLFYLPFEHGARGTKLLTEFNWLKANANVLLHRDSKLTPVTATTTSNVVVQQQQQEQQKPEVAEWLQKAERFTVLCQNVHELLRKFSRCANKEICHDLFGYVWDIASVLMLLNAFIKWLRLGHFPHNAFSYTQGSYTWFSKGWKETFMSGDQEPWVFRGGLIADLQRLMPVDSGNDLFIYKLPELPTSEYHVLRPYTAMDEGDVNRVCSTAVMHSLAPDCDNVLILPENIRNLIADFFVGPYVTLQPEFCVVAQNSKNHIVGYACAALNINVFVRNVDICWLPAMREKYDRELLASANADVHAFIAGGKRLHDFHCAIIERFHEHKYECPTEVSTAYPAVMMAFMLDDAMTQDQGLAKRLVTVILATLRANGCFGVHVCIDAAVELEQIDFYTKLGFTQVFRDTVHANLYLGRRF